MAIFEYGSENDRVYLDSDTCPTAYGDVDDFYVAGLINKNGKRYIFSAATLYLPKGTNISNVT